jgi:imidazolonepropionase-like amidohydrolase
MDKIAFALAGHSPDTTKLEPARALFRNRNAWVTPTLASLRALDAAGTSEYARILARPEMAYVDSGSFGWWASLRRDGTREYRPSAFYRLEAALVGALKSVGTRFLIGTDAANPLMVAGFSLHDEMETLVRDAGLTPYEVLTAATRRAAEFLHDQRGGFVAVGARADLLLVDANPLLDLRTLRRPAGVMVNGRWLDRSALDSLLAGARAR